MNYSRNVVEVNVTQKHIDEGTQKDVRNCAIARSLKEIFPDRDVIVAGGGIFVSHKNLAHTHETREFINKFDKDKSLVSPAQFQLIPSPYQQYVRPFEMIPQNFYAGNWDQLNQAYADMNKNYMSMNPPVLINVL